MIDTHWIQSIKKKFELMHVVKMINTILPLEHAVNLNICGYPFSQVSPFKVLETKVLLGQ